MIFSTNILQNNIPYKVMYFFLKCDEHMFVWPSTIIKLVIYIYSPIVNI